MTESKKKTQRGAILSPFFGSERREERSKTAGWVHEKRGRTRENRGRMRENVYICSEGPRRAVQLAAEGADEREAP